MRQSNGGNRTRRLGPLLSALLAVAVLAAPVVGTDGVEAATTSEQDVDADGAGEVVSSKAAGVRVSATRDFTRAEMLSAEPLDMPGALADEVGASEQEDRPTRRGPPRLTPGTLPVSALGLDGALDLGQSVSASNAANATQVPAGSYSTYPYRTVGKVFWRVTAARIGSCSAASIGNYAVLTAGHCVHKGNNSARGWNSNDWKFVPAYKDGDAPLGQWPAFTLHTTSKWFEKGNPKGLGFDIGGAVLETNASGQKISQVVGTLGFATNVAEDQIWRAVGYPGKALRKPRPAYNGEKMWYCNRRYLRTERYDKGFLGFGGDPALVIRCNMTGGSSGGPWIKNFRAGVGGNANYVNGVTSHGSDDVDETLSPYFGDAAESLKKQLLRARP